VPGDLGPHRHAIAEAKGIQPPQAWEGRQGRQAETAGRDLRIALRTT